MQSLPPTDAPGAPAPRAAARKPENPWANLAFNIALPALVLNKLSERLGPAPALLAALAFPLGYGLYDAVARRKLNFLSVLGFVSVLLTGGLGLLKVDGFWFAVKEAAVPALIGGAVLGSLRTKKPLVRSMLLNDAVLDVPRVQAAVAARGTQRAFDALLARASYLLAGSFFLSAALNFALARVLLKSPAGTVEFNQELGRMTALSWPVIVLPTTVVLAAALWMLVRGLKALTGLELEEMFHKQ
jgi:hypothetical protein